MKKRLVKHGPYYTYEREQHMEKLIYGLILVLCLVLLVAIVAQADRIDLAGLPRAEYTVQQGDTLWSIAKTYRPQEVQMQVFVYELRRINDLDTAMLMPGQTLKIIDGRCPQ